MSLLSIDYANDFSRRHGGLLVRPYDTDKLAALYLHGATYPQPVVGFDHGLGGSERFAVSRGAVYDRAWFTTGPASYIDTPVSPNDLGPEFTLISLVKRTQPTAYSALVSNWGANTSSVTLHYTDANRIQFVLEYPGSGSDVPLGLAASADVGVEWEMMTGTILGGSAWLYRRSANVSDYTTLPAPTLDHGGAAPYAIGRLPQGSWGAGDHIAATIVLAKGVNATAVDGWRQWLQDYMGDHSGGLIDFG